MIYRRNGNLSESSSNNRNTTIHFATRVEANIGASVDSSWMTGGEADIDIDVGEEQEKDILYSDHPLAAGLLGVGNERGAV